MSIELSDAEKQALLECMNITVRSSQNPLATAQQLLPLAVRISQLVPNTGPTGEQSTAE